MLFPKVLLILLYLTGFLTKFLLSINTAQVLQFTKEIHNYYNFTNLVLLAEKRNFYDENVEIFCNQLQNDVLVPMLRFSRISGVCLSTMINANSLALIFVDNATWRMADYVDESLGCMRTSKIVFVYLDGIKDHTIKLDDLFEWCWDRNIVNAVALFDDEGSGQIISYSPFPTLHLRNITNKPVTNVFMDTLTDLHGYRFMSYVQQDVPYVYKYRNRKGENVTTGLAGHTLMTYIRKMNGTFEEIATEEDYQTPQQDITIKGIADQTVEISLNIFHRSNDNHIYQFSYPIVKSKWSYIVPAAELIPSYKYLLKPFRSYVWYTVAALTLCIIVIIYFTSIISGNHIELGQQLTIIFRLVLYLPIPHSSIISKTLWRILYTYVIFLGFFLYSLYVTLLASFLATNVYQRQTDSVQDMINLGRPIVEEPQFIERILSIHDYPEKFRQLFLAVDSKTFKELYTSFNTSFIYTSGKARFDFYAKQQETLTKPLFRVSKEYITETFHAFPMQAASPFAETFNRHILNLHASGLYVRWGNNIFSECLEGGAVQRFHNFNDSTFQRLSLANLAYFLKVYACGITLSVFVFLCEFLVCYFESRSLRLEEC